MSDKEAGELEELLQLFELGLGDSTAFAAALQVKGLTGDVLWLMDCIILLATTAAAVWLSTFSCPTAVLKHWHYTEFWSMGLAPEQHAVNCTPFHVCYAIPAGGGCCS